MTGRPSIYSEALANEICTRIANGESLRAICREEKMPVTSTVLLWVIDGKHQSFSEQYTRARAAQGFNDAEKIREVAEMVSAGELDPQQAKVMIDAYKWTAERNAPKHYGNKIDMNHGGQENNPVKFSIEFVKPTSEEKPCQS